MKSKPEITLTNTELAELLMSVWANGWESAKTSPSKDKDNNKRKYVFKKLQSIDWKQTDD